MIYDLESGWDRSGWENNNCKK